MILRHRGHLYSFSVLLGPDLPRLDLLVCSSDRRSEAINKQKFTGRVDHTRHLPPLLFLRASNHWLAGRCFLVRGRLGFSLRRHHHYILLRVGLPHHSQINLGRRLGWFGHVCHSAGIGGTLGVNLAGLGFVDLLLLRFTF